ncbi:A/G-specific DNA-adenine glycosylase [Polynucleobacter meluiroseus]|uniref:Adenine DNA glycosylase n=1 Tax=Polynucleobacter meluiroseus TaxID=1938814 RepID=A0A240DY02_9BURK|nr:A/G-specific adenine glycosylase [Polynucleobacter meluiroseus]SNX27837.1 A/G-specific DNA-adenine glycosylase [Polynucleobacter meluiroseus]
MSKTLIASFAQKLLVWHQAHGREGLPWQGIKDPYAVWISEIMLQQTQVATVLERYPRFMARFPTVKQLALAPIDAVLAEWAGLGYYSRARNLHACAKQVMEQFSGTFPSDPRLLESLKGIGRSTAGAIAAFAFHERAPILDANVKRVLARLFAIEGAIEEKKVNDLLWGLAQELLPTDSERMPVYTQALMDFGATWCTSRKPVCLSDAYVCTFAKQCQANLSNQVLMLPQKKVKAKSPEFDADLLLMRHQNAVLLQRRPEKAIWGGLWSLPESPWRAKANKVDQEIQGHFFSPEEILKLTLPNENAELGHKDYQQVILGERIKHVFTHRRLWMQIWHMNSAKAVQFTDENLRWVSLHQLGQYGLPQPIKLLLQGLNPVRDDE